MASTVRGTVEEMLLSTLDTAWKLLDEGDALASPSSHVCAQGEDEWRLITNLIDHETEHLGQVLQGRYESRQMPSPLARLLREWVEARAVFLASLLGLTDEQFNTPSEAGQWSYREIAEHLHGLEQHALRTIEADRAAARSLAD